MCTPPCIDCTAPELDVVDRRLAAASQFLDMIEFQGLAFSASLPRFALERALVLIALPDLPSHVRWNVAWVCARAAVRGAWLRGRRVLALLELGDEQPDRALDHLGDVRGMGDQLL